MSQRHTTFVTTVKTEEEIHFKCLQHSNPRFWLGPSTFRVNLPFCPFSSTAFTSWWYQRIKCPLQQVIPKRLTHKGQWVSCKKEKFENWSNNHSELWTLFGEQSKPSQTIYLYSTIVSYLEPLCLWQTHAKALVPQAGIVALPVNNVKNSLTKTESLTKTQWAQHFSMIFHTYLINI